MSNTTGNPTPIGNCPTCGFLLYQGLHHSCPTGLPMFPHTNVNMSDPAPSQPAEPRADCVCPKCGWYLTGNRAAISGGCERCGWIPNIKRKCVDCGTEESSEQIEFDKDCKCGGRFAVPQATAAEMLEKARAHIATERLYNDGNREIVCEIGTFQAEAGEPTPSDYKAWLIQCGDRPQSFLIYEAGSFDWTDNADKSIHFSRRADAEQIAEILENEDIRICEHLWPAPTPAAQTAYEEGTAHAYSDATTPRLSDAEIAAKYWIIVADGEGADVQLISGEPYEGVHRFMCCCDKPWRECTSAGVSESIALIDDPDEWDNDEEGKPFSITWQYETGSSTLYRMRASALTERGRQDAELIANMKKTIDDLTRLINGEEVRISAGTSKWKMTIGTNDGQNNK